ncbi:MFS transporter [bacterium]|nr:MFS transporter [bacterium]
MKSELPRFHPATRAFRFTILIFISLLSFGSYFAYDIIGAVAPSLVEEFTVYEITDTTLDSLESHMLPDSMIQSLRSIKNKQIRGKDQFLQTLTGGHLISLHEETEDKKPQSERETILKYAGGEGARGTVGSIYTIYSIAAIFSVFIGGFMIDRLGTRKASMIFSILVFLGALGVAVAHSIPVLFIGRFIFGAGSEPLIVAQSAMVARWFKNKEIALAYGIALTVSRLGTLFSFNTGELISNHFGGYRYALIAAVLFCAVSLLANVVYIILDRKGENTLKLADAGAEEKIVLKDIRNFKPSFWFVTFLCLTFYSAIFPFTALSTDFFVDKWNIQRVAEAHGGFLVQVFNNFLHMFNTAGGITSIIIFASMIFAPVAGHLVDRFGHRTSVMIWGSLLLIPSYLALGLTEINPVIPMIVLGAAFVLVPAALWPSVPMVVSSERVGTAFGLLTMIQNIGLALFPFLNGILRDATRSYTSSMIMFASLGIVGLIFAVFLKRADKKAGRILESP